MGRKSQVAAAAAVAAASTQPGVDLSSPTEAFYIYVFLVVGIHFVSREIFKRVGPFKSNPDLASHQLCSGLCIAHCGCWGIYYWFTEAATVEDRLYGVTVGAVCVGKVNFAFQFYDLLATVLMPRLRKVEMFVHHSMAIGMCYLLLRDSYVHYYAIFFLGISEVSSIPLVFVDLFKYFPEVAKKAGKASDLVRIAFALLFMGIRVIYWPCIAVRHILDTVDSVKAGTVHSVGVVTFFLVCNLTLTVLQWFWGYLITRAAIKMITGGKKGREGGDGKAKGGKEKEKKKD